MPDAPEWIIDLGHPEQAGLLESLSSRIYVGRPLRFFRSQIANRRLRFVKAAASGGADLWETQNPTGATIKVAVGLPDEAPTGGTFHLTQGADTGGPLNFNATAAEVENVLNAMSGISSDGGVTVVKTGQLYTVTWNSNGARSEISVDVDSLSPRSNAIVVEETAGDGSTREVQSFLIVQLVYALQTVWALSSTHATGTIPFDKQALREAFAATTEDTITALLEIKVQFSGASMDVVYQAPCILSRDLINEVTTSLPTYESTLTITTGVRIVPGGISDARAIVTDGFGSMMAAITDATYGFGIWEKIGGNNADDPVTGYFRPNDFNASTNPVVWIRRL